MNAAVRQHEPAGPLESRAEAKRQRILDAAQQSFLEHGFHAASMAGIAEKAGVSAGLIYRYFPGKSDIIHAIVERQLDILRDDMRMARHVDLVDELVKMYGSDASCAGGGGRQLNPALLLEMSAEATRDATIAQALQAFDRGLSAALREWLVRSPQDGGRGVPAAEADARVLQLQIVFEGLKVRQTRDPALDRGRLREALLRLIPAAIDP